jgi:hypothetical protein
MAIPLPPGGLFPLPTPPPDPGQASELSKAFDRLGNPVQNLPGNVVGETRTPGLNAGTQQLRGYAVDLNDNGRYDRGQDAVVGLDLNYDGKLDASEIARTNAILTSPSDDADTNHDGKVSDKEKVDNFNFREQYKRIDRDGDGKVSNFELNAAGAKAWVDRDGDGTIDKDETQSINKIRAADKESRISEIDPTGKSKIMQHGKQDAGQLAPKNGKFHGKALDKVTAPAKPHQPAVPKLS